MHLIRIDRIVRKYGVLQSRLRNLMPAFALAALFCAPSIWAVPQMGPLTNDIVLGQDGPWIGTENQGAYLLENASNDGAIKYYYAMPAPGHAGRRTVTVDAALLEGDDYSHAGLLFGFDKETRTYFMFVIEANNRMTLYYRTGSGIEALATTQTDLLRTGYNHLAIVERHGEIGLHVNGKEFWKMENDEGTSLNGAVGIVAWGKGRFGFRSFDLALANSADPKSQASLIPRTAMHQVQFDMSDTWAREVPIIAHLQGDESLGSKP